MVDIKPCFLTKSHVLSSFQFDSLSAYGGSV